MSAPGHLAPRGMSAAVVPMIGDVSLDLGALAVGLFVLAAASLAAIVVKRRLDLEGRNEQAAGLTIALMVANLMQLVAVVFVLVAIFGR